MVMPRDLIELTFFFIPWQESKTRKKSIRATTAALCYFCTKWWVMTKVHCDILMRKSNISSRNSSLKFVKEETGKQFWRRSNTLNLRFHQIQVWKSVDIQRSHVFSRNHRVRRCSVSFPRTLCYKCSQIKPGMSL